MSDFQNLSLQLQSLLQIKLDGLIEACIHTARSLNIGLSETMTLTVRALQREMAAHKMTFEKAAVIWSEAAQELLPASATQEPQQLN